jgi:hypothetical protein
MSGGGRSGSRAFRLSLSIVMLTLPGFAACELFFPVVASHNASDASTLDGAGSDGNEATVGPDVPTPPDAAVDASLCEAGFAACGPLCVDLTSDPNNCGVCGHDCSGAPCVMGACNGCVALTTATNPTALAVDPAYVYWTDGSSIWRINKDGSSNGQATPLVAGRAGAIVVVVPLQGNIYWTECPGGVFKCPGDVGCPSLEAGVALWSNGQPSTCATGMAADPDSGELYFTTLGNGNPIMHCSAQSCALPTPLGSAVGIYAVNMAAASGQVYWENGFGHTFWLFDCEDPCMSFNRSAPPLSGDVTINFVLPVRRTAISLTQDYVYWALQGAAPNQLVDSGGFLWRAALDGGDMEAGGELLVGTGTPSGVAATDTYFYFTDFNYRAVYRCAKAGCSTESVRVAAGQNHPGGLVQDDVAIYWSNYGSPGQADCTICKLAK